MICRCKMHPSCPARHHTKAWEELEKDAHHLLDLLLISFF